VKGHLHLRLEEQLDNNEISKKAYFAAKKRNEEAADNHMYEKGSPRTLAAAINTFGKMCVIDKLTHRMDDTYEIHPNGCKRRENAQYAFSHKMSDRYPKDNL
jgi:hypothetical protein